jgi:hypothetical protein
MLGAVDASHIIRCVEYWDLERTRYPQYKHTAVLIAENITSRFLNVISLFNLAIPIIAIQLNALRIGGHIVLDFVEVLDETIPADNEEDDAPGMAATRSEWERKRSKEAMEPVDRCVDIVREFAPTYTANYKEGYIGLTDSYRAQNFLVFVPKREFTRVEVLPLIKVLGDSDWAKPASCS